MIAGLLKRTRLIATVVLLLSFVGVVSWLTMPRQEDPSFAERFATLLVPYPGGSTLDVERLVVDPMEDRLAEVVELDDVRATARPGIAVFQLRLRDAIGPGATDAAWDEVRRAIERARPDLPAEALAPSLDNEVGDPASAVVLITGSDDPLELRDAVIGLEARLQRVPGVERVKRLGDPGRRIEVALPPETAGRLGISAGQLAQQLRQRNVTVPGGSVVVDGRSLVLRHLGELTDVDRVREVPVRLPSGRSVPLGALAEVHETVETPRTARVFHNGRLAVGLSIVPVPEQDVVALGDRLRTALDQGAAAVAPLEVEVFAFQPDRVRDRIAGLTASLVLGVLIVAGVVFLAMGVRMGVVVSAIVPLVALGSVAIYAVGGGVLHQISIAALVLALGLLVDNAIVVAESVQQHLDAGDPSPGATAVRELAVPLGTATGTTVAAFLPMLLAQGGTADFTRMIPFVVVLTLVLSYAYALVVTPALATALLRPRVAGPGRLERLGRWIASVTVRRPRSVLGLIGAGLALTSLLALAVPSEFFPMSERDQILVSLALPEGTEARATERVAEELALALKAEPGVVDVTAFVGGGLPRFYYNLNDDPSSPHRAEIVVRAPREGLDGLAARVRELGERWPDAELVPKRLQQGPPVGAPIQVRLQGWDLAGLAEASDRVVAALRGVEGTRDVRSDLGTGVPTLELAPDDAWAGRLGTARASISLATLAQTHGVSAGVIRNGDDPIDIRVSSPAAEHTSLERLETVPVDTARGPVPLVQVADPVPVWRPAALRHRDGDREVTVSAELAPGTTFTTVLARLEALDLTLPPGVTVEYGGEAEGSGEANTAILRTLPLGLGLLVFFLLLEFDSFRRLAIILSTVPLAAVGVVPGLALTGQPFGFMSMLGVIALVGIVVNNAIVLLNLVERRRREGSGVDAAVAEAIRLRLRPILLTTVTTVAGLFPLAVSSSALWPPLAWAMISGLLASTALTLLAVPALYQVLFAERPAGPRRRWLLLGLLAPAAASAAPLTLTDVIDAVDTAPMVQAAEAEARASRRGAEMAWLDSTTPTLLGQADNRWRDEEIAIDTPIGPFVQQPRVVGQIGVRASQPVLDPTGWAAARAASHGARARQLSTERTRETVQRDAVGAFLDLVALEAQREAVRAQREAVARAAGRAEDLFAAGLALESDALRASVAVSDLDQALKLLDAQRLAVANGLAAQLGIAVPGEVELDAVDLVASARPDLAAADQVVKAAGAERVAQATRFLPRVTADVGWQTTDNATLVKQSWSDAGLTARWSFGAGRVAQVAEVGARRAAAVARRDALERGIAAERAAAGALEAVRASEIAVRTQSVLQAERAAAVLQDRYGEQLATLTDVLDAEAMLARERAALAVARAEWVRAKVELAYAGG